MSIAGDKKTVERMIRIYCRLEHGRGGPCPECAGPCPECAGPCPECAGPCPECAGLIEYAIDRLDRCPHGDGKPPCRACSTHCYEPGRREAIRAAMRKAGPLMLLVNPIQALRHLLSR